MFLWWLGNAVFLLVIVPVVVALLAGVVRPALQIKQVADQLAETGPLLVRHLDTVGELATTQNLVHETTAGLARYGAALDRVL
ncbi:MAG: hypothetical protein ACR2IP_10890 [Solirubrobacteraceae bacterium]